MMKIIFAFMVESTIKTSNTGQTPIHIGLQRFPFIRPSSQSGWVLGNLVLWGPSFSTRPSIRTDIYPCWKITFSHTATVSGLRHACLHARWCTSTLGSHCAQLLGCQFSTEMD